MNAPGSRHSLRWLLAAAAMLASNAGCEATPTPGRSRDTHVASASCPLKTPADWQAFLEATVEDESWVATCASDYDCDDLVGPFRSRVESDILATFESCTEDIAENPPIAACTERLRRFIPAWLRQHTNGTYGFSQGNAAYLAAQTGENEPAGMMDPPPEILQALPQRASIERAASDNGWPYITHDSAVGGVRTFITISDPDGRFDRWLLVGLESQSVVPDGAVLSLIAVQKKEASGRELARPRMHFRDYLLSAADGSWTVSLPELHEAKCYACHPSGARTLIATHEAVVASAPVRGEPGYGDEAVPADFGFERLAMLNERLLGYGPPDWDGAVDPADHGPRLGESLGCPECHDGIARGVLNLSTDERTLRRKVVEELGMGAYLPGVPFPDETIVALLDREKTENPPLTEAEAAELARAREEHLADYEELAASRFPAWRSWALGESCAE